MAKRSKRQRAARAAAEEQPQVAAPAPAPARAPVKAPAKAAAKPVVIEMAPEEDVVVTVNYDAMTKLELQELCDAAGISYGRMTAKSTLARMLKG
jgi:hypothetical protein